MTGAFTNRNGPERTQNPERTWNNQNRPYVFIILVYKIAQGCVKTIKIHLDEYF